MTLSAADRLAILEVITRADDAASRRDADAYVELFTPDAVLDGTQGQHAAARHCAPRSGRYGPPRARRPSGASSLRGRRGSACRSAPVLPHHKSLIPR